MTEFQKGDRVRLLVYPQDNITGRVVGFRQDMGRTYVEVERDNPKGFKMGMLAGELEKIDD